MNRHTAPTEQALLAPTTELATNTHTLPQFRLPEVRRDRDRHLAQLFRDICYLDSCEGCFASNAWFERQLGVVESTIKRLLGVLVECDLVAVEVLHGNERRIRPLARLAEVVSAGWRALCRAVLDRQKLPAALRRLAASQLKRSGSDLGKLGLSHPQKCAPPAPRNAPPFPVEESEAEKTTTVRGAGSEPRNKRVVVSPAEVPEPESEAVAVAVEAGLDRNAARRAVGEKPLEAVRSAVRAARVYAASHEVRSLPALLVTAIRAGWLAPAPPSSHGSDRGERPVRVVVAPAQMRTETVLPRTAEPDASSVAWEGLSEGERAELLAVALTDVLETASEAEKALVRRRGVDSLPVVMRAKRLARDRAEVLGATDAG